MEFILVINTYSQKTLQAFSTHFYSLVNIISGKYLILVFMLCIYISYTSINDKPLYTSYTSDNYNDYILSKFVNKVIEVSKFSIHKINNKILHPITLFLQNL